MATHDRTSTHVADEIERPRRSARVNGGHRDGPPPTQQPVSDKSQTLASAVGRHPFLVILPAVILLAVGVVVGSKKAPTYSATATINVGKADIATQATPGYVQASEALAASYSRLVSSQHVAAPAARLVGSSPTTVASHLSAVPIPSEPTFTLTATGATPQAAVKLANAAVLALRQFAAQSSTQQGSPTELLNRYNKAQATADGLQAHADAIAGRHSAGLPGITQAEVNAAKVAGQTAALKAQALSNQYLALTQQGAPAPQLDVLVNPTAPTSTNRTKNIEKYGVIGAVAGLVIGIALAALAASAGNFRARRRTRTAF